MSFIFFFSLGSPVCASVWASPFFSALLSASPFLFLSLSPSPLSFPNLDANTFYSIYCTKGLCWERTYTLIVFKVTHTRVHTTKSMYLFACSQWLLLDRLTQMQNKTFRQTNKCHEEMEREKNTENNEPNQQQHQNRVLLCLSLWAPKRCQC